MTGSKITALDFFEKNKDIKWFPPAIPDKLTTDYEIANWAMNNLDIGWIDLDLNIDIDAWKEESKVANKYFVDHRGEDHPGWNSCCIHGIDIDKTGSWNCYGYTVESEVPYRWTELSNQTPVIKKFWQEDVPVEKYRRIRFMELEPKGFISPHSDAPGQLNGELINANALEHGAPMNIAIIHPENCYMVLDGFGIVPFKEGKAFIINIRHYHSVINFSDQQRVHMIGHGWYGNKINDFCKLIARSYRKQYEIYRKL